MYIRNWGLKNQLSIVYFSYTNRQYLKETKRLKYQSLLKNHKDKIGITEIEEGLNKYNSKTCNIEKVKEYITEKIKVNETLVPSFIPPNDVITETYIKVRPNIL